MRRLTSRDAQFLALETRRQTGHVASVAILDPSTTPTGTLTVGDIEALITDRLRLLPPLRWRLREVPLGLDYPYWIDDADCTARADAVIRDSRRLGVRRPRARR